MRQSSHRTLLLDEVYADQPLPRGRIFLRALALFGFIIAAYNIFGEMIFDWMRQLVLALLASLEVADASPTLTGVIIGDYPVDLRLYWLPSALSLLALSLLVLRPGFGKSLFGALLAIAFILASYGLQVAIALLAAAHGLSWGASLASGGLAYVLVLLEFLVAFVIQLAVALSGRPRVPRTPRRPTQRRPTVATPG